MKFVEPTKPHRKSGMWGTLRSVAGRDPKVLGIVANIFLHCVKIFFIVYLCL